MTENNTTSEKKAYYIVTNAQGEQFLLPYYSETFRVLMDDKDNRYFNIELQNRNHPFFLDRLKLYNSYQTLRGKYEYNRSTYFKSMDEKQRSVHFYELPETVSIWLCNFQILKSRNIFKDTWAVYSEDDVNNSDSAHRALPVFNKNRYIIVDLPNFKRLRKNISSREDYWLKLLSQGPLEVPESKDPIFRNALNRLRVSHIKPELLKVLEEHMFDKHADEAIEAEIWLKAEAKGAANERAKNEALNDKKVEFLRAHNVPEELIAAMEKIK